MKERKWATHIIAVLAFVVFIALGSSCASLPSASKNLVIPKGIWNIPSEHYAEKGIETVVFPESISTIFFDAFRNNNLTSITFPPTVEGLVGEFTIYSSAFENNQLTSVTFPTIKGRSGHLDIWNSAFANNRITDLTFPENTTVEIHRNAFKNNQITNLSFPDNVKLTIGEDAFSNNHITNLTLPKNVSLSSNAFRDNQITNVVLPHEPIIYEEVFKNNNLHSLTIPNMVKIIQESAFENNELVELELPEGLEKIETLAFAGNRLTSVRIPQSVIMIEEGAFDQDVVLTGKSISLTHVIETVELSKTGNITTFKVFDSRGNAVTLRKPNRIPLGVHTITASVSETIKVDTVRQNNKTIPVEYTVSNNLSVTHDFKKGFSYRLIATVTLNERDIDNAKFQAARLGNTYWNEAKIGSNTNLRIEENALK